MKRIHLAFQYFFRRVKLGEEKLGYPRFKSKKHHRQSFTIPQSFKVDFEARRVQLPKIGSVKTIIHRKFEGIPKECQIVTTSTSKIFISIAVEDGKIPPKKKCISKESSIGIDVGLSTYVTLSTGEKINNPRHLQNTFKRLQCLHRRLSKKKQGSKNCKKARQKLARYYERIANQRADFQHKLSTRLIRENQAIIVEHLNISGMVRNRKLARHILDAAWNNFLSMLKYKAEKNGVTLFEVGRFKPTSKLCSVCGFKNITLTLSDREWLCPKCDTHHDRDINAAQNIKLIGLASIMTPREPREEPVELSALAEAVKQEIPLYTVG